MKTLLMTAGVLALSASTTVAACTAPFGRYGGAAVGISYDAETMQPKEFQNRQFLVNYNRNGSGSVQIVLDPATGSSVTANFPARGLAGHSFSTTTCSGKVTASALGQSLTLAYVVVSSGNEIMFSNGTSGAQTDVFPYVITVKKQ